MTMMKAHHGMMTFRINFLKENQHMNAIKIATTITKFANRVAYKLLAWRWKANLKHAEVSLKASNAAKRAAEELEKDADKQLAEAAAIRQLADTLKD